MRIWKNTPTIDEFFDFSKHELVSEKDAEVALVGSKPMDIEKFPMLRGIFRVGVGVENLPFEAAAARNVQIALPSDRTRDVIYEETADFSIHLIFKALFQDLGTIDPWIKSPRKKLTDKKLVVVGNGNIGGRVASKMSGFVKVTSFDAKTDRIEKLEAALPDCDCVSFHIPLSDNAGFFSERYFEMLRPGATLVNTARAGIIDEQLLARYIRSKGIRAYFDVFWKEPYQGPLLEFRNSHFFATPHVASTCDAFLENLAIDFEAFLNGLKS